MRKFFLKPEEFCSGRITITGDRYNHARVLRMKAGDTVTVCDGKGNDYFCEIDEVTDNSIILQVKEKSDAGVEPSVSCRIYMAYPKSDKLEHVIQKATELGADEIVAYPSAYCVFKADEKGLAKKLERWQKIAEAAAEQSGRGVVPEVRLLPSFQAMLEDTAECELRVFFYENEDQRTFRAAMEAHPWKTAALVSGPEGGFSESEVRQAQEAGLEICTLGKRILRCETAPLCGLSALMYEAGEF